MDERITDQLQQELMDADSLEDFLRENDRRFQESSLPDALLSILNDRKMSKSELARSACTSEVYLHQIFSGRRLPSRSRLLCLCFGLNATVDETQHLLRQARLAPLYPRDRRDAVILYGLSHDLHLSAVNDRLFADDMDTLY